MKLSVIIPCYNAEKTLAVQLRALAGQEFSEPWEVILADNGSTDNSVRIAKSFQKDFTAFRIVDAGERRGAAYARNRGASEATGEFLAFCDADDEVAPGYVRAICEALSRHEFIACRYDFDKLNTRWVARFHGAQTDGVDHGSLGPYVYAGGGSLGVRREIHEAVGGFDEAYSVLEDTDYCLRIQRSGIPLHFAPDALVHVRWRSTICQSFSQARRWGRCFIAIRARHWPVWRGHDPLGALMRHLLGVRHVRNVEELAKWIWSSGWQVGSVEGWRDHLRKVKRGAAHPSWPGLKASSACRPPAAAPASPRTIRQRIKEAILFAVGKLVFQSTSLRDYASTEGLRREFGRIDPTAILDYPLKIGGGQRIQIGAGARISSGAWLYAVTSYGEQQFRSQIRIGDGAVIGRFCHIVAAQKISIGKGVILGERVFVSDNLHDYRQVDRPIAANELLSCGEIHVGENSRIEENVCIVGNVRIGHHCVVGANSVLTCDLPPFSMAAGIPARIIKRFNLASERWEAAGPDADEIREEEPCPAHPSLLKSLIKTTSPPCISTIRFF